jgi:hypothetical protein
MRRRVSGRSKCGEWIALETVIGETPAKAAISFIFILPIYGIPAAKELKLFEQIKRLRISTQDDNVIDIILNCCGCFLSRIIQGIPNALDGNSAPGNAIETFVWMHIHRPSGRAVCFRMHAACQGGPIGGCPTRERGLFGVKYVQQ